MLRFPSGQQKGIFPSGHSDSLFQVLHVSLLFRSSKQFLSFKSFKQSFSGHPSFSSLQAIQTVFFRSSTFLFPSGHSNSFFQVIDVSLPFRSSKEFLSFRSFRQSFSGHPRFSSLQVIRRIYFLQVLQKVFFRSSTFLFPSGHIRSLFLSDHPSTHLIILPYGYF
jgi:uncharacterized phage infection (PIP) family protein YhgE